MPDKNSFLFIPDITGFTDFVNVTEIEHGQHIISELLEGIINADQLDLTVSEVEGDAVMFYKHNSVPAFERLVTQSEKIFIDFHERIKKMEARRICRCGACTSAINLSLKMVAHVGQIGFTQIKNIKKPYGADVVKIHSFLKNKVDEKEYVLLSFELTELYREEMASSTKSWLKVKDITSEAGKITYFSLVSLFDRVKEPELPKPPSRLPDPYAVSIIIQQEKERIFELLLNFDMRILWNRDVKEILYDKNHVNHVGTKHQCVLNDNSVIEFESFTEDFGKDVLVYGERILDFKFAKSVSTFFILEQEGSGSRLTIELHIAPLFLVGGLLKAIMINKLSKSLQRQLEHIKEVSEQLPAS